MSTTELERLLELKYKAYGRDDFIKTVVRHIQNSYNHGVKQERKRIWESLPSLVIEGALAGNTEKMLECVKWMADFQLAHKSEFEPFIGLGSITESSNDKKS